MDTIGTTGEGDPVHFDPGKYVQMPHLFRKRLLIEDKCGVRNLIDRWDFIQEELRSLQNVIEGDKISIEENEFPDILVGRIERCMIMFNPSSSYNSNVNILRDAVRQLHKRSPTEALVLVSTILFIIDCALMLPSLFPEPVLFLNQQRANVPLVLTKEQICCILSNAFFCTFPKRDGRSKEYKSYPRINFTSLYDDRDNCGHSWRATMRQAKLEKVKCFLNYFSTMKKRTLEPSQSYTGPNEVYYERRSLPVNQIPNWEQVNLPFGKLSIFSEGLIEEQVGTLQVDFANEFVGGGTLGNGVAQEEIRFACCPELVAAQLFTEVLGPLDALHVHHFEQFSSYKGYSATFQYAGSFQDNYVKENHIVAMDAFRFWKPSIAIQLEEQHLNRELNKCIVSFQSSNPFELLIVSSGKWGCGVFKGDPLLKCLLQWMAASYCEKRLRLYTVGDIPLMSNLKSLISIFEENGTTVGDLYVLLNKFGQEQQGACRQKTLMEFLTSALVEQHSVTTTATDSESEDDVTEVSNSVKRKTWWMSLRSILHCIHKRATSGANKLWSGACLFFYFMCTYLLQK